jgi:hypothetical protein
MRKECDQVVNIGRILYINSDFDQPEASIKFC